MQVTAATYQPLSSISLVLMPSHVDREHIKAMLSLLVMPRPFVRVAGVLASYLPSTELYAKFTKAAGTPLNQQSPAANTAAASGTAQQQQQQEQKQGQQQEQREDDLNHSPDQLARQIAGSNHPASAADVQMNMARFAMLNLLSVTILTLCMAKISAARDALPHGSVAGEVVPAENFYLPVITAVHGFYMPPPGQKKNPVV